MPALPAKASDMIDNLPSLAAGLSFNARLYPEKTLYVSVGDTGGCSQSWTYAQTDQITGVLAYKIRNIWKIPAQERVILLFPAGVELCMALLACQKANVTAVPVYPPMFSRLDVDIPKLENIINDSGARYALTDEKYNAARILAGIKATFTRGARFPSTVSYHVANSAAMTGQVYTDPAVTRESVGYLQYTSGSTGIPKGVIINNDCFLRNAVALSGYGAEAGAMIDHDAVFVSWLPTYHDMGLMFAVLGILSGATIVLIPPLRFLKDPSVWIRTLSDFKAQFTASPNFGYYLASKRFAAPVDAHLDLSNVRFMCNGAEPVTTDALEKFYSTFAPFGLRSGVIKPCYGMAESVVFICGTTGDSTIVHNGRISLGSADGSTDIRIVNPETLQELPDGVEGEIWMDSPSKARGYYNREDESKRIFSARIAQPLSGRSNNRFYLRTGDLGFMYKGQLFYSGRFKDLIIIRGRNYVPSDVESIFHNNPHIRAGCVAAFGIPADVETGEKVVVVAELREDGYKETTTLMERLATEACIASGVPIWAVVLIKSRSIPKTSSGKIRWRETKDRYMTGQLAIVASKSGFTMSGIFNAEEQATSPISRAELDAEEEEQDTPYAEPMAPMLPLSPQLSENFDLMLTNGREMHLKMWLQRTVKRHIGIEPSFSTPLATLGITSIQAVQLASALERHLQISLPASLIMEHNTIDAMAHYISFARPRRSVDHPVIVFFPRAGGELQVVHALKGPASITQLGTTPSGVKPGTLRLALRFRTGRPFHQKAFQLAWETLVRHTAMLNTSLTPVDGLKENEKAVGLRILKLDERNPAPLSIISIVDEKAVTPPILRTDDHGKLWDACLLSVSDTFEFHFQVQCFLMDEWSLTYMGKDLGSLYAAARQGESADSLSSLMLERRNAPTVVDFELARQRIVSDMGPMAAAAAREHWNHIAKVATKVTLPSFGTPATSLKPPALEAYEYSINAATWLRFRTLCQKSCGFVASQAAETAGSTAAFTAVLSRFTGQKLFCIGTVLLNRTHSDLMHVSGALDMSVPFHVDLTADPSFLEHFACVLRQRAESDQHLPFVTTQDMHGFASIQEGFTYAHPPRRDVEEAWQAATGHAARARLTAHGANSHSHVAAELRQHANQDDGTEPGPQLHITFDTERVPKWFVETLCRDFESFLDAVCVDPNLKLSTVELSKEKNSSAGRVAYEGKNLQEPVAVIGMGCKFPKGCNNPGAFFDALLDGVDGTQGPPNARWATNLADDALKGGFLSDIESFDPEAFGLTEGEATGMDPHQRILLQVVDAALADAGFDRSSVRGRNVGVFIGNSNSEFLTLQAQNTPDPFSITGGSAAVAANRVSRIRFAGTIHSGGHSVQLFTVFVALKAAGVLSTTFVSRPFDSAADGYVRGEGCGIVVLRNVSAAREFNNTILSVIKGSAVTQNGPSPFMAAPVMEEQVQVMRTALENAGIAPAAVAYVEAHGTGTKVGDRAELLALNGARSEPLIIGASKSNFGHLEGAAGILGLIKTILVVRRREAPPNIHFEALPAHSPMSDDMVFPLKKSTLLGHRQLPLRAGVNSFGIGGTNAHIVLEEWVDDSNEALGPVMMFAGQGTQRAGLAVALYRDEPVFRRVVDEAVVLLAELQLTDKVPLLELLLNNDFPDVKKAIYAQPLLFVFEYALAKTYLHYLKDPPAAVLGHSFGEFAAACISGAISYRDCLKVVVARAEFVQSVPNEGHAMVALRSNEATISDLISKEHGTTVSMAAVNGKNNVVVSGLETGVMDLVRRLGNPPYRKLETSHAFHSQLMRPAAEKLIGVLSSVAWLDPTVPFISTATGQPVKAGELSSPDYWTFQMLHPVRFYDAVGQALSILGTDTVILEIGPNGALARMAAAALPRNTANFAWFPLEETEYAATNARNRSRILALDHRRRSLDAPTYQQRSLPLPMNNVYKSPLLSTLASNQPSDQADPHNEPDPTSSTSKIDDPERDNFYETKWSILDIPPLTSQDLSQQECGQKSKTLLVLLDTKGVAERLAEFLTDTVGYTCVLCPKGDEAQAGVNVPNMIRPDHLEEYIRVFHGVASASDGGIAGVINGWLLDLPAAESSHSLTEAHVAQGSRTIAHVLIALQQVSARRAGCFVLTCGAIKCLDTDRIRVEQTPAIGFAIQTIIELPNTPCVVLDIPPDMDTTLEADEACNAICRVLKAGCETDSKALGTMLAIRDSKVFRPTLVRYTTSAKEPEVRFSNDGTLLVTGGLGGVGLEVCDWLARKGVQAIVVLSRSAPNAVQQKRLNSIRSVGATLLTLKADISDRQSLRSAIKAVHEHGLPNITGVFHAAGIFATRDFNKLTDQDYRETASAKLDGSWNLHEETKHLALNHFVLFSTCSTVLPATRSVHYGSANAFLDGLAIYRRDRGLPCLSVNFGPFDGIGMTNAEIGDAEAAATLGEALGLKLHKPDLALKWLDILMGCDAPPVVGAYLTNWPKYLVNLPSGKLPLFEAMAEQVEASVLSKAVEVIATKEEVLRYMRSVLSDLSGSADFGNADELTSIGISSLSSLRLQAAVADRFKVNVGVQVLQEHSTVERLADYIYKTANAQAQKAAAKPSNNAASQKSSARSTLSGPIAIIGMGCRLPADSTSPDRLWDTLCLGIDGRSRAPNDRWGTIIRDPNFQGGFLSDSDLTFDLSAFGIKENEAQTMDPQHLLLLQTTAETLKDAGYNEQDLRGNRVGSFVGITGVEFLGSLGERDTNQHTLAGTSVAVASARINKTYRFTGPSITLDAACSSSLYAFHLACNAIQAGDCEMAIAGGCTITSAYGFPFGFAAGVLSPDYCCKVFDEKADGYMRSEGCALTLLKSLGDAQRDGNRILCTVEASKITHLGATPFIEAPSMDAERDIMCASLRAANLTPNDIPFLEAHGTGTVVGDGTELSAITQAYAAKNNGPLWVGASKSNIGHTEAATAALIKSIYVLRHREIPPNLHFNRFSKGLAIPTGRIALATKKPQALPCGDTSTYAAINAFGIGGTCASVILKEWCPPEVLKATKKPRIALLCSGQGLIPPGIAKTLYEQDKVFSELISECAKFAADLPIVEYLTAVNKFSTGELHLVAAANFTYQYALARSYLHYLDQEASEAILAYGGGEVLGACLAGCMTVEQAIKLIAAQSRFFPGSITGMYPPAASCIPLISILEDETKRDDERGQAIDDLAAQLDSLRSHVGDKATVTAIAEFERVLSSVPFSQPVFPIISTGLGRTLERQDFSRSETWGIAPGRPVVSLASTAFSNALSDHTVTVDISADGLASKLLKLARWDWTKTCVWNPPVYSFDVLTGRIRAARRIATMDKDFQPVPTALPSGRRYPLTAPGFRGEETEAWERGPEGAENLNESDVLRVVNYRLAGLLKHTEFDPDAVWREIGMHPLHIVEVSRILSHRYDVKLPVPDVEQQATPRMLASKILTLVKAKKAGDHGKMIFSLGKVIPLTLWADGPRSSPIFGVHPITGLSTVYRALFKYLNGPAYAALAAEYINHLKSVQPAGPYMLFGYSLGGNIVLWMAKLLTQIFGDKVSHNALIDSYLPEAVNLDEIGALIPVEQLADSVAEYWQPTHPRTFAKQIRREIKHAWTLLAKEKSATTFLDLPITTRVLLVKCAKGLNFQHIEDKPTNGLKRKISNLQVEHIDCGHFDVLAEEPYIANTAALIDDFFGSPQHLRRTSHPVEE
ncbi:hypothetical protein HDU86_006690 [Geranomyces michiganensis]|nr:hypothetical protein HDU86_006690 [Geranomyces michiganensis]